MIEARATIQLIGRPVEVLQAGLRRVLKEIKEAYEVKNYDFLEPEEIGKNIFSAILEIEFVSKNVEDLFNFILEFGPISLEILKIENEKLDEASLEKFLNEVISKLMELITIVNKLKAENISLKKRINELMKK